MAVYCLGIWHWTAQNPQALEGWVFSNAVGDWILTILTHNFATLPVAGLRYSVHGQKPSQECNEALQPLRPGTLSNILNIY